MLITYYIEPRSEYIPGSYSQLLKMSFHSVHARMCAPPTHTHMHVYTHAHTYVHMCSLIIYLYTHISYVYIHTYLLSPGKVEVDRQEALKKL